MNISNSIFIKETNEKWMKSPSNFEGLVLGCMDSYDSNQILILQGFSRSTRFSYFCTAQISKFQRKTFQIVAGMKMKFHFSFAFFDGFCDFSAKFWWNLDGISQKWREIALTKESHYWATVLGEQNNGLNPRLPREYYDGLWEGAPIGKGGDFYTIKTLD